MSAESQEITQEELEDLQQCYEEYCKGEKEDLIRKRDEQIRLRKDSIREWLDLEEQMKELNLKLNALRNQQHTLAYQIKSTRSMLTTQSNMVKYYNDQIRSFPEKKKEEEEEEEETSRDKVLKNIKKDIALFFALNDDLEETPQLKPKEKDLCDLLGVSNEDEIPSEFSYEPFTLLKKRKEVP